VKKYHNLGGILANGINKSRIKRHLDRTVAVIGDKGFIGSSLSKKLKLSGHVVIPYSLKDRELPPEVDTIFYLAGRVTPSNATQQPGLIKSEIECFQQLITHASRSPNLVRVVLASSGGTIYDPNCQPPYREDFPLVPNNLYGHMKLEMENIVLNHSRIEPVVVRLANVYGPNQKARRGLGVIAHWLNAISHGKPVIVLGDPNSTRDYVFIDDVVGMLLRICEKDIVPPILNIGSGTPVPLRELICATLTVTQYPWSRVEFRQSRQIDRVHAWLDVKLAKEALGWHDYIEIDEGICKTWAWFCAQNGSHLRLCKQMSGLKDFQAKQLG
jgi:UDP-glucose 4-epimerase